MRIRNTTPIGPLLIFALGFGAAWLAFGQSSSHPTETAAKDTAENDEATRVWTCSMHPQIRRDGPGNCPRVGSWQVGDVGEPFSIWCIGIEVLIDEHC